jgi:hypothetical protein
MASLRSISSSCYNSRLVASNGVGPAAVTLLGDGELDTLALGQRDPGLLLTNDTDILLANDLPNSRTKCYSHDVSLTSGELVVNGVLDVDNVEASVVALTVVDDTNTTHVATTSDHDDHTSVEGDEVGDLAGAEVNLDGIVDLDGGVRVADTVHSN